MTPVSVILRTTGDYRSDSCEFEIQILENIELHVQMPIILELSIDLFLAKNLITCA